MHRYAVSVDTGEGGWIAWFFRKRSALDFAQTKSARLRGTATVTRLSRRFKVVASFRDGQATR